jgi:hypothetical protein
MAGMREGRKGRGGEGEEGEEGARDEPLHWQTSGFDARGLPRGAGREALEQTAPV